MSSPPPPIESALGAIGNTPVVRLGHVVPAGHANVYLKLESLNPTGSYKDRMAKPIIEEALRRGDLKPGMTVVEASGGSTGSSLAFVCAVKGYKFHIVSSNAFATEKLRTMGVFGTTADLIQSPSGQVTKDLIPAMVQRSKELAKDENYFLTNQFHNQDAFIGYADMANELIHQFPNGIDAFCSTVGTAGMAMGVARVLKRKWPQILVVVCEPATSPVLSEGTAGTHHVEGVGIGYWPPLLDREYYDEVLAVSEQEGRNMSRRLAAVEGLLVGTSTGLNVTAAIALAKELGPGKTVVTVACDTGLKYLNGDLFA